MLRRIIRKLEELTTNLKMKQLDISTLKAEMNRDKDIETLMKHWKLLQARNEHSYDNFSNLCIFATLNGRDISFLSESLVKTRIDRERNTFGRLLAMTLFEFIHDINKLLGRDLRNELVNNRFDDHLSELKSISKEFSNIKHENNSFLRELRHNAAAHKTKNAQDLYNFYYNIDPSQVFDISIKVSTINNKLTRFTTKILYSIIEREEETLKELREKLNDLKSKK